MKPVQYRLRFVVVVMAVVGMMFGSLGMVAAEYALEGPTDLPGQTCPESYLLPDGFPVGWPASTKLDTTGDPMSVTATAPDGYLIAGFCVKAGDDKEDTLDVIEGGPLWYDVVPDSPSVTFGYVVPATQEAKAISHYTIMFVKAPEPPMENEWCSPGYWKNNTTMWSADLQNARYNTVNDTSIWLGPDLPGDPTLLQVLQSPKTYGGDTTELVADYLSSALGFNFTGERYNYRTNELGNPVQYHVCPLEGDGNLG